MLTPSPEPRRLSIRLPRPLWIGLAAMVLIVVTLGLEIGLPIYRQQAAIREIERLGGNLEHVYLDNTHVTDIGVSELQRALPSLTIHR